MWLVFHFQKDKASVAGAEEPDLREQGAGPGLWGCTVVAGAAATTETHGAQAGKRCLSEPQAVTEWRGLRMTRASSSWVNKRCNKPCYLAFPPCLLPQAFHKTFGWEKMPHKGH